MALLPTQQWWMRTDGDELNGGGFDATISGAGTNYSDQAAAQLSLTDIVTIGTTHVASATGGFTSQMIGNILRLAGDGYYAIVTFNSTNSVEVDRATGTATGQSGRVGGAHRSIRSYSISHSGATGPLMASPLIAGNRINVRGTGGLNPSTPDYHEDGYYVLPQGNINSGGGYLRMVGYNGRPCFLSDAWLLMFTVDGWLFDDIKFMGAASIGGEYFSGDGFLWFEQPGVGSNLLINCILDQCGQNAPMTAGNNNIRGASYLNCSFLNSGATGLGSQGAVAMGVSGGALCENCLFEDVRGWAISIESGLNQLIQNCLFIRTHHNVNGAIHVLTLAAAFAYPSIINCTIVEGDGPGISNAAGIADMYIRNTIIANNVGDAIAYLSAPNVAAALVVSDYNDFFNNGGLITGSGPFIPSLGSNDQTLDPQFTNASGGDYSIGTNLKAKGAPVAIGATGTQVTLSSVDIGVSQRPEGSGGGSGVSRSRVQRGM
jgi:hypothetical protein